MTHEKTVGVIDIDGIGMMEIETDARQVSLVGALSTDGSRVNVRRKIVYRSEKLIAEARKIENPNRWLQEIGPGEYMLRGE